MLNRLISMLFAALFVVLAWMAIIRGNECGIAGGEFVRDGVWFRCVQEQGAR